MHDKCAGKFGVVINEVGKYEKLAFDFINEFCNISMN